MARAAEAWGAQRVVAEKNNGGDMVESVLRGVEPGLPVRLVHASEGKAARAEPVAALFEAGKARLVGRFPELEDELAGLTARGGYEGRGSPDRADAIMWAMQELAKPRAVPRVRVLWRRSGREGLVRRRYLPIGTVAEPIRAAGVLFRRRKCRLLPREDVMTRDASSDYVAAYRRNGFVILRGIFPADEVRGIAAAAEEAHEEGLRLGRSFRHGNLFYRVAPAGGGGGDPVVQMVQWPSYHQAALNAVRLDRRFAAILKPLIGGDVKQIINQIHWKARGATGDFAWHQDSRFRKPDWAYRNLGDAYVQTGLALDPHTPEAGCLRFVPGSHLWGALPLEEPEDVLGTAMKDAALEAVGLRAEDAVDVVMEPGDIALWSPFMVHGSGTNRAAHKRRLYINGYVRAEDCDRGEWTFRDGRPVPLGPVPALVHYEALRERGGPHFV